MSHRPTFAERRRVQLARKTTTLDALEGRSMITESLGILTLGIGLPAALAGPKESGIGVAGRRPGLEIAPRPEAVMQAFARQQVVASTGRSSIVASPSLGRSPVVASPSSAGVVSLDLGIDRRVGGDVGITPAPSVGGRPTGGGGPTGGGSGSVAGGGIRPLRFDPPKGPDAASGIVAATGNGLQAPRGEAASASNPVASDSAASTRSPAPTAGGGGGAIAAPMALVAPTDVYRGLLDASPTGSPVARAQFTNFPLYTLDYNHGTVLFPGFDEVAIRGTSVDLRAQVRNAAGATFSWNTTNLTHATGISAVGDRLSFTWTTGALPQGVTWFSDSVTLTATAGGNSEVQTYTFDTPLPSSGSTGGTTWPEAVSPDLALSGGGETFASQNVAIDADTGAARAEIALPAYSPNFPGLTFSYDSTVADPRPMILERHTLDAALAVPDKVSAGLTFNGTVGSTSYYATSTLRADDIVQIALQADATGLATGRYGYTVNWGDIRGGATTTGSASGTATVINEAANPIGSGWTLDGLKRINAASGGVILNLGTGGLSLWFAGAGPSYTAPAGEFSTLVKNADNTYTRTLIDGTVERYDTSGYETATADRDGLRVTYAYSSGKLSSISDPYGKVTSFAYDASGKLQTVTDPALRVTTFAHNAGGDLTAATLPDSGGWSFGYGGSTHRLTSVTDPRSKATTIAYDAANRVGTITRPDLTTETFQGYQTRGFVTGTTLAAPGTATLLAEAKATHVDPNGHATDLRMDWRGQGRTAQMTDPDGFVATTNVNAAGLATDSIDRLNRFTRSTYDASGRVATLTFHDQKTQGYAYNAFSEITQYTDARGKNAQFTYDAEGHLTEASDATNARTTLTYTANGKVASIKDANSRVTSYAYDGQDRLATLTYALTAGAATSATTLLAYDAMGNVATVTDERGNSTTYSYDPMDRVTGVKDALNNRTTYSYDLVGNLTQVQAPLSRTTAYAYDSMNRLTTLTAPLSRTTTLTYDPGGNLRTETDPLGRTTTLGHDAEDRPTTTTMPLSGATTRTATVTYNAEGQVVKSADFLNRFTTYTYNSRGWVATTAEPGGRLVTFLYTETGKPSTTSDTGVESAQPQVQAYGYDDADRPITFTDALGRVTTTVYDPVGNVTAVQRPLGRTTNYAYDARNRLTTITDPLSHSVTYSYDSGGNVTRMADALGHATLYGYDALNREVSVTDARSAVTSIAFDAAGREIGLTDPTGNRTTWAYDAADRMTTETAPVPAGKNGVTTFAYDAADQLIDQTDRDGRRITYAYDSGGRQVNERWLTSSGGTVRTVSYSYDAMNEMVGAADPDSLLTFTYDSGGRQASAATSSPAGQPSVTLSSTYAATGERLTLADSLASVGLTSYSYDAAHRITQVGRSYGSAAGPYVAFGYDAGDRLTSLSRTIGAPSGGLGGPGGGGGGTSVATTFAYDLADRLTTLTHGKLVTDFDGGTTATPLATYLYGYDAADRLQAESNAEGAVTYTYDNADELTGVSGARVESYGYDSGGNRNTAGYSTVAGNQLSASSGFTYTYDDQGNQTAKTETASGKVTTFAYDYRNRMVGATQKDSGGNVTMLSTYTYDALNRRIATQVDVDGAGAGAAVKTWSVYDGTNAYADFDGSGTLQRRYLYAPAIDSLLARTDSGGTTAWYLTDRLGTVRDIVSSAGAAIDHLGYDGFGRLLSESSPSSGDRFKFTGREQDAGTGLQFNRTRYYDAAAGRWTQRDKIGFGGGDANLYRYVSNGPTAGTDPTGEWVWPWDPNAHWPTVGEISTATGIQGTITGGVSGEVYLGIFHIQVGIEIGVGVGPGGLDTGVIVTGGAQPGPGIGAGISPTIGITTAPGVAGLNGPSTYGGISTPGGGLDIVVNPAYVGATVSLPGPGFVAGVHLGDLTSVAYTTTILK